MEYYVHRVTPLNTGLLANVDQDVFDSKIDSAYLAAYASEPLNAMFVAVAGNTVIGQIRGCVHLQPDRASDLYIDNLGTATSFLRRGIASALITALLAWGRDHGCSYVWVATELDNEGARGFYAAHGFKQESIAMFSLDIVDE